MRLISAFGLGFTLIVGCSRTDNDTVRTRDEALASAARVSGTSMAVCTAITYDADGDGTNESSLMLVGEDDDGDGYAVEPTDTTDIFANGEYACSDQPVGNTIEITSDSLIGADCNDGDATVSPATTEVCDSADNDCDGSVDDGVSSTFYADVDGDGLGDAAVSEETCSASAGYVSDDTDCDDSDATVGAAGFATYLDADGDSYGDENDMAIMVCSLATGDITDNTDCNDGDSAINPGATEFCDSVDNDCDSSVDEGVTSTFYADVDGDSYGDATVSEDVCTASAGYVSDDTDCDDADSGINPGASDTPSDGIDQDCDGSDATSSSTDADGDGYVAESDGGDDCDDSDATVNPGATEVSMNGVDDNCDGAANVSDTLEACATPTAGEASYSWTLLMRDWTVYPDGNDDPNWAIGYSTGTDERCSDFTFVHGNTFATNGSFDIDGDGTYGEEPADGDGVWLYQDVVHASVYTVGGVDILSDISTYSWGTGEDGHWDIDLL